MAYFFACHSKMMPIHLIYDLYTAMSQAGIIPVVAFQSTTFRPEPNMRYLLPLIMCTSSFSSPVIADRDIDSIMEVAQAYREQRINVGQFGVREEVRKHLFTKGNIIFPDATNLPTIEDANKKWVNAKLLNVKRPPQSGGKLAYVEIAILIDENGEVIDTYIIESSNDNYNMAADTAARSWKFKPASVDEQIRKTVWIIPFIF